MSQFNGSSYSQSLHTLSHRLPRGRCSLPELGIHQAVSCRWGSSSLLHAPLCSPASALLQQEGSSSPVPVRCSYIPYPGIQGASQCGSTPLRHYITVLASLLSSPFAKHPSSFSCFALPILQGSPQEVFLHLFGSCCHFFCLRDKAFIVYTVQSGPSFAVYKCVYIYVICICYCFFSIAYLLD